MTDNRPKWMTQVRGTGRHLRTRATANLDHSNVEVALHRIRRGDPAPVLNVPECRAVVAVLTTAGWSTSHIATVLGLAERSVVRHRAALPDGEHLMPPTAINLPTGEWASHPQRACAQPGVDPDLFFPPRGVNTTESAKAICQRCPVLDECRDYAIPQSLLHGIWGGTTETQRRRLRNQHRASTVRSREGTHVHKG